MKKNLTFILATFVLIGASTQARAQGTITSPNGGESWVSGSSHNITWTHSGSDVRVKLQLYQGSTRIGVIQYGLDLSDDSFPWTVGRLNDGTMAPEGDNYFVRLVQMDKVELDLSDRPFSITSGSEPAPTITVTSPNGGESWEVDSTHNITWTASNVDGTVEICLYHGVNLITDIARGVNATAGSYPWRVNDYAQYYEFSDEPDNYSIRVQDSTRTIMDDSDGPFSIPPTPRLSVTSPNGGESWELGSTQRIHWTARHVDGLVNLVLFNGGSAVGTIVIGRSPGGHYYDWRVGDYVGGRATARTGYRVRVVHSSGAPSDESLGDFTITEPGGTTPTPAGGNDFTISDIYLEPRSTGKGIRLRVTNLAGDFNGWVVFSSYTEKMGRGNAVKERRRLELRRGVPAWVNLADIRGSYFDNECYLDYIFQVNPDREVRETNYDNNRVSKRLFWNTTHDGRADPVQGLGRNNTRACQACPVTIRPVDVASVDGNRVSIRLEISVRNCGGAAIRDGTVRVMQTWPGHEGGAGEIDRITGVNLDPGQFRRLNRTVTLVRRLNSKLAIEFDCDETGTLNSNNNFYCLLNFKDFIAASTERVR